MTPKRPSAPDETVPLSVWFRTILLLFAVLVVLALLHLSGTNILNFLI